MAESTMAQVSSVACRPLPGTSGPLPPATPQPQAPPPHSTGPRRLLPRTDGGSRAEPRPAGQVTAPSRLAVPDPSAVAYPSSQPPQPWCCDDHLNSPNALPALGLEEVDRHLPEPGLHVHNGAVLVGHADSN